MSEPTIPHRPAGMRGPEFVEYVVNECLSFRGSHERWFQYMVAWFALFTYEELTDEEAPAWKRLKQEGVALVGNPAAGLVIH